MNGHVHTYMKMDWWPSPRINRCIIDVTLESSQSCQSNVSYVSHYYNLKLNIVRYIIQSHNSTLQTPSHQAAETTWPQSCCQRQHHSRSKALCDGSQANILQHHAVAWGKHGSSSGSIQGHMMSHVTRLIPEYATTSELQISALPLYHSLNFPQPFAGNMHDRSISKGPNPRHDSWN